MTLACVAVGERRGGVAGGVLMHTLFQATKQRGLPSARGQATAGTCKGLVLHGLRAHPQGPALPSQAGGFVADGRVNGSLNLSRALGDLEYKQTKELGPEEQARGAGGLQQPYPCLPRSCATRMSGCQLHPASRRTSHPCSWLLPRLGPFPARPPPARPAPALAKVLSGIAAMFAACAQPGCPTQPFPRVQMVTAMPEIRRETLQPGDEFLILACDGIWDVLTNQEVRSRLAWLACMRWPPRWLAHPELGWCAPACAHQAFFLQTPAPCQARAQRHGPHTFLPLSLPRPPPRRRWTLCASGWARASPPARWPRRCATTAWPPTPAAAARAATTCR